MTDNHTQKTIDALAGTSKAVRDILSPASTDARHGPIVLEGLAEGELRIVAEMAEVLG